MSFVHKPAQSVSKCRYKDVFISYCVLVEKALYGPGEMLAARAGCQVPNTEERISEGPSHEHTRLRRSRYFLG